MHNTVRAALRAVTPGHVVALVVSTALLVGGLMGVLS